MARKSRKGAVIPIGLDDSGLKSDLKKIESQINKTKSDLSSINYGLKLEGNMFNKELLNQKNNALKKQVDDTREALTLLKEAKRKADIEFKKGNISSEEFQKLNREIAITSGELNKAKKEWKDFKKETSISNRLGENIQKVGGVVENVGGKISGVGQKLTTAVTVPIAAGFAASINEAVKFDEAMRGVAKTTDLSAEEFTEMQNQIREMSKSFPYSREEIGKVIELAAQLGVAKEDLVDFGKSMLDIGVSTNITTESAAEDFAKFFNIISGDNKDAGKMGSSVVALGNSMATTEKDIMSMAMRLAAAGKTAGMEASEILALAATFSSLGLEAEAGGSAVSTVMKKMTVASEAGIAKMEDAKNQFKKYGTSFDEVSRRLDGTGKDGKRTDEDKEFLLRLTKLSGMSEKGIKTIIKDANKASSELKSFASVAGMSLGEFSKSWENDAVGTLMKFFEGLQNIDEGGGSVLTTLEDLELDALRVSDSILRAYDATDLLGQALSLSTEGWNENKALLKESTQFYESDASKMKTTVNSLSDAALEVGIEVMPLVRDVLKEISEFADSFSELDESTKDFIVKGGIIAASGGPFLQFLGSTVTLSGKAIKGIGLLAKHAGLLASPAGGIALGATALYMFADELQKASEQKQYEKISNSFRDWNNVFQNSNSLVKDWGEMNDEASKKYNELSRKIEEKTPELTAVFESASKTRRAFTDEEKALIKETIDDYNALTETVLGAKKDQLETSKFKLNQESDVTPEVYGNYNKTINEYYSSQVESIDEINDKKIEAVRKAQKYMVEIEKTGNVDAINRARDHFKKLEQEQVDFYNNNIESVKKDVDEFRRQLDEKYWAQNSLDRKMIESLGKNQQEIERIRKNDKTNNTGGFGEIEVREILERNKNIFNQLNSDELTFYTSRLLHAQSSGKQLTEIEKSTLSNILFQVSQWRGETRDQWLASTQEMVNGLSDGSPSAVNAISKVLDDVGVVVGQRQWTEETLQMTKNLGQGINSGSGNVLEATNSLTNQIGQSLSNTGSQTYIQAGYNIVDGITQGIESNKSKPINAIQELAINLIDAFKNFLGINSPSKVMMDESEGIPEGVSEGIKRNIKVVGYSSQLMSEEVARGFNPPDFRNVMNGFNSRGASPIRNAGAINSGVNGMSGGGQSANISVSISFPDLTIREESDTRKIANEINKVINQQLRGRGAF